MKQRIVYKLVLIFMLVVNLINAQNKTITGTVLDETANPLPGASIVIKGTSKGTSTDFDGNYTLQVQREDILIISYIGYVPQEIPVGSQNIINVTLQPDTNVLNEVVVVGFGTQKKENVTGATAFVKMDEVLGDRPIVNAAQALQGAAPGLQVVSTSGQPGATGTSINIRGFTSINGGSPLILINNVPGSLEDINPKDIESVSVLKDAAASSIYGARAAFGVVLITTKQAKRNQKIKFDYSVTTSMSKASEIPEKATTREFVEALNTFGENSYFAGQNISKWLGLLDLYDTNRSQLNLVTDPVTGNVYPIHFELSDNQYYPLADSNIIEDFIDNFGYSAIHNFGVSGGGEKVAYRLNVGYSYEDGVMVTNKDSYTKYNINTSVDADISSNLTSTTNILYRSSIRSVPPAQYASALQLRMYDPTGFFDDGSGDVLPFESPGNVVRYSTPNKVNIDNLRLFEKLEYKPIKNVSLNGEFTYEKEGTYSVNINNAQRYYSTFRFNPTQSEENAFTNSSLRRSQTHRTYQGVNLYGKYKASIGDHNFDVLLGFNKENEKYEYFTAFRNSLIDPTTPTFNLATGENFTIADNYWDWAVVGYFGRFNYNYKERYFLEGNLRYDGSSRFAPEDRFVWLPSFSAGWNVTNEPFMDNIKALSLLKFRASWGQIGNQIARKPAAQGGGDDYYPTIPGYENYSPEWINLNTGLRYVSFIPAQLISPGLTWETITSQNIGVDLAFFNSRLTTTFDYFIRDTKDMLTAGSELPDVLGAEPPFQNAADLRTEGWDLQVGWRDSHDDFNYGITVNVWDNQSEITKFDNPAGLISQYYVGQKIGEIWGYVTDGYYTVDDFVPGTLNADLSGSGRQLKDGVPYIENAPTPYPGDVKYKDLNGDGIINDGNGTIYPEFDSQGNLVAHTGPGDRQVIGNSTRRYQFGINGNIGYKGFDFSFALNGVGKRDVWRGTDADVDLIFPYISGFDHIYKHQLNYWTPDNQDAFYPRIYGDASTGNTDSNYGRSRRIQTKYLSDESYLRIQNITLGYSISKKALEKMKIDKLRIFIAGNNLHTFDKLPKGMEPDQNTKAASRYPIMTQYSLGVNLSF